jgi:hypothetical protein
MIKNLIVLAAVLVLLSNFISDSDAVVKDYKVIEKNDKTEIRLYESGEKYRCTLTK